MLVRMLLSITWTEAPSLGPDNKRSRGDQEEMMIDERELTSKMDSELIIIPE